MRQIPLVNSEKVALIDDKDYGRVSAYRWYKYWYRSTVYAKTFMKGKSISMQNFILDPPDGMNADHRDGNGLNNQRDNLRPATLAQQRQNKSKHFFSTSNYKGVSWSKEKNKWVAQICINGKQTSLGRYSDPIDAAKAYDTAAKFHYGEFAKLNFPEGGAENHGTDS